jgi:hypothetical protein
LLAVAALLAALLGACGAATRAPNPSGSCEEQRASCEAACESRILPGSSEKAPEMRGEMEADRCRASCITPYDSCQRARAVGR